MTLLCNSVATNISVLRTYWIHLTTVFYYKYNGALHLLI